MKDIVGKKIEKCLHYADYEGRNVQSLSSQAAKAETRIIKKAPSWS